MNVSEDEIEEAALNLARWAHGENWDSLEQMEKEVQESAAWFRGCARAILKWHKPTVSVDAFREKRSEQARNAKSWTSDEAILEQINASLGR